MQIVEKRALSGSFMHLQDNTVQLLSFDSQVHAQAS